MYRWQYTGRGGGGGDGGGVPGGLFRSAASESRNAGIDEKTTRDNTIIGGAIDTGENVTKRTDIPGKGLIFLEKEYRMILLHLHKGIQRNV